MKKRVHQKAAISGVSPNSIDNGVKLYAIPKMSEVLLMITDKNFFENGNFAQNVGRN